MMVHAHNLITKEAEVGGLLPYVKETSKQNSKQTNKQTQNLYTNSSSKDLKLVGQGWGMPLIPALRSQRQADI